MAERSIELAVFASTSSKASSYRLTIEKVCSRSWNQGKRGLARPGGYVQSVQQLGIWPTSQEKVSPEGAPHPPP